MIGAGYAVSDLAILKEKVFGWTDGRGADVVIEAVGSTSLRARNGLVAQGRAYLAVFGTTVAGKTLQIDTLKPILEKNH